MTMAREIRLRELLVGIEGLALLRHLYDGSARDADQRIAEVRRLLDDDTFDAGELTTEQDTRTGYRAWARHYDEPGNPLIELEQDTVWALLADAPVGDALDAACGTGRHARHLADLGHRVTGVDLTPEMLDHARRGVPTGTFTEADLRSIPLPDNGFDLVVCGLALAHLPKLADAVGELARVLRPGGRLVISVLHPFQAMLGWQAPFQDADGQRGFVREYEHGHADYVTAFRAAGLTVHGCAEPALGPEHIRAKRRAFRHIPDAATAAYLGLPGVLVWDVRKR
jgi:SAM-dependent methyltransferase